MFFLAPRYRRLLGRVVFIGVTGSGGKSTTCGAVHAVLSARFKGRQCATDANMPFGVCKMILGVKPWHRFYVQEIATGDRDRRALENNTRLLAPRIGIVTNVGGDHISMFGGQDAIAAEKSKLIAALPPTGTAILNVDDERVLAMAARAPCPVITYGLAPNAIVRAENVRSAWPRRLSFTLTFENRSVVVQTQLCGAHMAHNLLAAIATGLAMGMDLEDTVEAVKRFRPVRGRMEPVEQADGVTFIRDDVKAPLWSIPLALDFMKEAEAERKIIVIGTISDYRGNSNKKYRSVAAQALDAADHVFFVGPRSSKCLKAKKNSRGDRLQAFYSLEAAIEYLHDFLRPGDLVLLKGSRNVDDLVGIIEERSAWLEDVERGKAVPPEDSKRPRNSATRGPFLRGSGSTTDGDGPGSRETRPPGESNHRVQIVVGLGNTGARFENTPHNVGQRVVDELARDLGGEWRRVDRLMVARVERNDRTVYLAKPLSSINRSGPALLPLAERLGIAPSDCFLVHDDMDLPLGAVRARWTGSDGGHKGVRSVLGAFGTASVPRVKVGVWRPGASEQAAQQVLAPFSVSDSSVIATACSVAARKVLEMLNLQDP